MKHVNKILKKLSQATNDESFNFSNPQLWNKNNFIKIKKEHIRSLCKEAIKVLSKEPTLLQVTSPVQIVGDIHGQFYDLIHFMRMAGPAPLKKYIFLGDYVDRGNNSVETISFLLALKVKFPDRVWILRGNHESPSVNQFYGFYEECSKRYTVDIWHQFNKVFSYLPIAAVISSRIFCVHGGLSPYLNSVSQISSLKKPFDIPNSGTVADLLWSDPSTQGSGFQPNSRGISYTYGSDIVNSFLRQNTYDLICRAHQLVLNGYEFPFNPDKSVLTIFSAPNYCNTYQNKAALLRVEKSLECKFTLIDPAKANSYRLYDSPITKSALASCQSSSSFFKKHKKSKKK